MAPSSRVMLTNGSLPSTQLDRLAAAHPFTQQVLLIVFLESEILDITDSPQLDIVFPASDDLEKALASVQPTHRKKRCTLSEFLDFASSSANGYAAHSKWRDQNTETRLVLHSDIIALPSTSECDDTWCIDPRGVLTLCVSKSLYEQLGLVGKRLSFKGCPEQYGTSGIQGHYGSCAKEKLIETPSAVMRIPLRQETESAGVRARQKTALKLWDELRENGPGKWEVLYCQGGMYVFFSLEFSCHGMRDS